MPRLISKRFFKFLVVGGGCTLLDFILFYGFFFHLKWPVVVANLASYGTGLAVAFFINRAWTFSDGTKKGHNRLWLSLLWGYVGLVINTGIVWILAGMIHAMLAKTFAVVVVLFYNYFTNKYLVFKAGA